MKRFLSFFLSISDKKNVVLILYGQRA